MIDASQIETFARDGAICVRGLFADWADRLGAAADRATAAQGVAGRQEFAAKGGARFVSDLFLWRREPEFRAFVLESAAAELAGRLLGASKVNVLFDHLLVKEARGGAGTSWHHDLPFWPIAGRQVLTIWLALDRVTRESGAVECIAGSHLWPERFRPVQPDSPETRLMANMDLPRCPDFGRERDRHSFLSWDLEPGDCLVFHALTVHGAGPNLSPERRRRGLATRWCGDDIRFVAGRHALPLFEDPGLQPGAPLDSDLFPIVWRRPVPVSLTAN